MSKRSGQRFGVGGWGLGVGLVAAALAGCAHTAQGDYSSQLANKPRAYVGGTLTGAVVMSTMHRRDFVYAIDVDGSGRRAAFTHLAPRVFRLDLRGGTDLTKLPDPPPQLADAEICSNEFDPEGLAFSPDGTMVAVAARDAAVRIFDLKGNLLRQTFLEEPLASLAWSPDGKYLVAGSEHGLLTVLNAADLSFGFDLRAHQDAARELAFADDGTLWSGGWDKIVRSFKIAVEQRQITEVRLHADRKSGLTSIHGIVNNKAPVSLTLDERNALVTLSPEAAVKSGIDPAFLKDRVEQLTPGGTVELPVAKDQTLTFKNFVIPHVDVAICETCQPQGVDGVLGKAFAERFATSLDEANKEVIIRLKDPAAGPNLAVPALQPGARWALDGFVNDLTVSRDGTRLGVAMNETKAERTLALYKREKAGEDEPVAPGNVSAIVDATTGKILEKHNLHHGIVSTAAISPDGKSLASGGWDKKLFLFTGSDTPLATFNYGWSVRKVRFSPDGRLLAVAAWTPQNARNADSDPAAQLIQLIYGDAKVFEVH
ncbi:MAG: WD40 repeat domain-containing protein [Deltaproteobacteria bacterium]|nr:WD40 repeat domain-containing protein [Deltaproteobacteria bacterium]